VWIGYAHTGAEDPTGLKVQTDALRAAGCERLFVDAGSWRERPELDRALAELSDGHDCLIVCRLDRLGRSLRDLIATIAELEERGIGFRSLEDGIETAAAPTPSASGIFRALARSDRALARERTRADVMAARTVRRRSRPPRSAGVNSGMEFAPDLIEPIIGFRHWRLVDGMLTSMFSTTPWTEAAITARCPVGRHDPAQTPSPGCTCGVYAYYDPCPRTASASTRDLVGGAVVVWGRIEAHATGVRAEHVRIVGLDLPLLPGRKRRAVSELAELFGVPAVAHRELMAVARAHGSPLPASLRPPRSRVRGTAVDPWADARGS